MTKYNTTIGIGKQGINLIRSFVDENQSYFHEILQENDVGIDAFIEFTKDGENDGRCIAVQIKTGDSYFNANKTLCRIPIDNHYEYWKNHSLDVYGIVCDCSMRTAYWVSISDFLEQNKSSISNGTVKAITFPVMTLNELTTEKFATIFKMLAYKTLPNITFELAMELSQSRFLQEKELAIPILMHKYADKKETWDRCLLMLEKETEPVILNELVKYICYVPHHADLWGDLSYSTETKNYAKKKIQSFEKLTIMKLLDIIEDCEISRGTIGQSVESIISLIPDIDGTLLNIIFENPETDIGLCAFGILAYYNSPLVIQHKLEIEKAFGEIACTVFAFIDEYGQYELYI